MRKPSGGSGTTPGISSVKYTMSNETGPYHPGREDAAEDGEELRVQAAHAVLLERPVGQHLAQVLLARGSLRTRI